MREKTAPDMATITESLERSMQNCSLSNRRRRVGVGEEESSTSDDNFYSTTDEHIPISDRTLELNSHISLPRHWEQCLDLKTGEIYYINWKNGMKVKEDPRRRVVKKEYIGESYSEGDSSYDSEESSSESSSPSLSSFSSREKEVEEEEVLVVAGCRACFMYFMVPKLVEDCPKCSAQLIHFDRPDE
ncbi:PREDICTED: uncharacterized protein LOC104820530 [Tarenaya hassleriana]|uniref:uncharacterized protein LOC104820530 n=1 Tax=Tarenaya hassleriana TaxID=28532 RepID=UPI00053C869B|nr:PREDICTED: uncharacterized protein LOC104820530 [Tarenaya hassleriana]